MLLKISHTSSYSYDLPVPYALQQVRLKPKSRAGQTVKSWRMELDGAFQQLTYDDENNNHVALLSIEQGRTAFSVRCIGEVETTDNAGIVGSQGGFVPLWHYKQSTALTKPGPLIKNLTKSLGTDFENEVIRFHALSELISDEVTYSTGKTSIDTTAEAALGARNGVCQDHAHIFVACARLLGFPARYVSGYLMIDGRVEQEATHAWAEVHLTSLGWVGFDVSNKICPDERYVRIATGMDYQEAAPISGVRMGSGLESMIVSIQIQQ